jgi:uncharacterized membrane protein YczE
MYILGLFVLAFGVAMSINSRLGVSPVNAVPYITGRIFGTDPGRWATAMFILFALMQIAILKKDFRPFDMIQIIFAIFFGYFLDFALWIQGGFQLPTYFGQLAMLIASIILIAAGLVLIISTKIIALPPEALCMAIAGKIKGAKFHNVKIIVDSSLVINAIALSLLILGGLEGIREGTVLSAILIGKTIPPIKKALSPILRRAYKEEQ